MIRHVVVTVLCVVLLGMSQMGCSKNEHMLNLTSDPPGAEVWLKRSGTTKVEGGVTGVAKASAGGDKFEEPEFKQIGNTPMEYSFKPSYVESKAGIGGLGGGKVTKTFKKGIIEYRLDGHKTFSQNVVFNKLGEPILVNGKLEKE